MGAAGEGMAVGEQRARQPVDLAGIGGVAIFEDALAGPEQLRRPRSEPVA